MGAMFVLAVGDFEDRLGCSVHFITRSPLEAQVCVTAPFVGSRAPDD